MTTQEYLRQLEALLQEGRIAPKDREEAVARCGQHILEAGPEREAETLADLGTPEELAQEILEDYRRNLHTGRKRGGGSLVGKILIGIVLSPVIVVAYCCVAGLLAGGAFCVLAGVFYGMVGLGALLPGGLGTFLNFLGGGAVAIGAGLLCVLLGLLLGTFCNFCMRRLFGGRRTEA